MARSAARLKMGYYPLPESEGAKLRELSYLHRTGICGRSCVGQGSSRPADQGANGAATGLNSTPREQWQRAQGHRDDSGQCL